MRLAALLLLVSASSALAQAVDCEALKGTTVPYQISWKYMGGQYAYQVYRDKSGGFTSWLQVIRSDGIRTVSKSTAIDGVGTETLLTSQRPGKDKSLKIKTGYTGYPKGFDRRTDIAFKMRTSITYADASTTDNQDSVSYRFIKEEQKAVGPCTFKVALGELIITRDDKPLPPIAQLYFPDIRGPVMVPTDANTQFELTTRFTPLELVE